MTPRKICVLASGGLDSGVLMARLLKTGREVYPLYISEELRWEKVERFWLKRFLRTLRHPLLHPLTELSLPVRDIFPRRHWSLAGRAVPNASSKDSAVYLRGRNVLLLGKAALFCAEKGISEMALATLSANPFPDAKPSFLKAYGRLLSQALRCPIRIQAPYRTLRKADVIRLGRGLRFDLTFSCLAPRPDDHPCGRCNKCAERRKGFQQAGFPDPTPYAA